MVVAFVCIAIISGCSSSDARSTNDRDRSQPQLPGDTGIVPREDPPAEYAPANVEGQLMAFGEATHSNGSPSHYADGSPVFMPDGSPIDYRPRNVMQQLRRVPVAYVRESTGELVMLVDARSSPVRDPETGDICWRAFECVNPNCSHRPTDGSPNLYGEQPPGVSLAEDGRIVRTSTAEPEGFRSDICPHCGSEGGEVYEPEDVAETRKSMMDQLQRLTDASLSN